MIDLTNRQALYSSRHQLFGGPSLANDIITLREAAERSGLSLSHLRHLARTNRLKARKIGRDWVTTSAAVDEYVANEFLRSRRPYKSQEGRP